MEHTHNSLATTIGWVSTCLLAGGASTLFNESSRAMWMIWGSFGISAAVGLDITARARERVRMSKMNLIANRRFERDMKYEADDQEANAVVRDAVNRILGRTPSAKKASASRRAQRRYPCDLAVEIHLYQDTNGAASNDGNCTRLARVTNLSESGFELRLTERLPHRQMEMTITAANGRQQRMFGKVMWSVTQDDGSMVAGGRFLDAASVDNH